MSFFMMIVKADIVQYQQGAVSTDQKHSVTINPPSRTSTALVNVENQLRCWQNGKLIVLENGWHLNNTPNDFVMRNHSQKLYIYDYGDTFCLYLED